MFRVILVKEIRDDILGYRVFASLAIFSLLMALAIYVGAKDYETQLDEYAKASALSRVDLEEQTQLYSFAFVSGYKINKPPTVLRVLVRGIEGFIGRSSTATLGGIPKLEESEFNGNPILAIFGALDPMFIVQVVISLFAFLYTYSIVCGEKESGTLRFVLSNAIPRYKLLLGKITGSYISFMIPFLFSLLLGFLLLHLFPRVQLSGDEWFRVGLLSFLFLIYISTFFCLSLFISSSCHRSTAALLLCLISWMFITMIVPRGSLVLANWIQPPPSLLELEGQKQAIARQVTQESYEELNTYVRNHGRLPPQSWINEANLRLLKKQNERISRLEAHFFTQQQRYVQTAINISRISPSASLAHAAMSISRTGIDEQRDFLASVREYQHRFEDYFAKKAQELVQLTGDDIAKVGGIQQRFTDVPRFIYNGENLRTSFTRALPDFGLMLFWTLLFFSTSYYRFLRYDPR